MNRCGWVTEDPIYLDYHDQEWGKVLTDENRLFEMLILEGAQAGLSWLTVLKKREHYREVFDQFDPRIVAGYGADKITELLEDPGIIRNRLKVNSAVTNARAFLKVQEEFGTFYDYLWNYIDHKQIVNECPSLKDVPITSHISDIISKDLKKRGFKFVGSTIIYSYMQAIGMVNDHVMGCEFR